MMQMISEHYNGFKGALIGRSGDYLIGWACNLAYPTEFVTIDLIGDGEWLGSVRAQYILELDDVPFEGVGHGFMFTLQSKQWQSIARIEAWVTNSCHRLGVFFTHQEKPRITQVHNNFVTLMGGLHLVGWAWDVLAADVKQKIYVYEAGRLVAEGLADKQVPELVAADCVYTKHGFNVTLPFYMADGSLHELVVVTADGKALYGSPVKVITPSTTLHNWVDALALPQTDLAILQTLVEQFSWFVPTSTDFSFYPDWYKRFTTIKDCACATTSVLVCITGVGDLHKTLDSLLGQTHINWMALVCTNEKRMMDSRIHAIEANQWQKQLQTTISVAVGVVSFVMAGDTLPTDALASLVEVFDDPVVQIVYTDCDQVLDDETLVSPWFKPDWNPDLFLVNTPLHFLFATRPNHLNAANKKYLAQLEAWPWLAVQSVGDHSEAIYHIPRVLYHQRFGAIAPVHLDAQRCCDQVLAPQLMRILSANGEVELVWPDPIEWPSVSLIVPTRDHVDLLKCCIDSLLKTDYPSIEVIVMNNDSADADALAYLEQLKHKNIRVIDHPGCFNFAAINNHAVQQASGSIIGLINNDIEVTHPNWLKVMVRQLLRLNVGAVGAKLLWRNGMVQHGGVVLGLHGLAGHTGNDWYNDDAGYFGYNQMIRSVSAVTAACLVCRREDYNAVDGLDEHAFPVNFNDVDFCLKLRMLGKRIIWTPEAELIHAESASRGEDVTPDRRARMDREKNQLIQKWHHWIIDDPYYNPNLNLDTYSHAGLAMPPRQRISL